MATLPTIPLVPVDEYLTTAYEQDKEFVDGRLVDKGMPTFFHQLLSKLLVKWFDSYESDLRVVAIENVRTQIIERARYRLPDVMVLTYPVPVGRIVTTVPNVVIEIMSPDDRQDEIIARFRDYAQLGVENLILMHPEEHIAWRFQNDSLIKTDFTRLQLTGNRQLPFESDLLFAQLRRKVAQLEGRE